MLNNKTTQLLNEYGFQPLNDNEYIKEIWTIKINFPYFEIYADPEIDTRYYINNLDYLEKVLKAI